MAGFWGSGFATLGRSCRVVFSMSLEFCLCGEAAENKTQTVNEAPDLV